MHRALALTRAATGSLGSGIAACAGLQVRQVTPSWPSTADGSCALDAQQGRQQCARQQQQQPPQQAHPCSSRHRTQDAHGSAAAGAWGAARARLACASPAAAGALQHHSCCNRCACRAIEQRQGGGGSSSSSSSGFWRHQLHQRPQPLPPSHALVLHQQQLQPQLRPLHTELRRCYAAHAATTTTSSSSSSSSSGGGGPRITNPSMPGELASLIEAAAVNSAVRPPPPPLEPRAPAFASRRSGVIAIKAGMMQDWDEYGARVPLTVLWLDECMVVRHKHKERDGVTSLVLGCGAKRAKQLHPRQLGEFQALGLPLKRKLWECPVTEDALLPTGTHLGASHFVAGQYLDVTGVTKGKGFAGVMKRWGFAGQGASHGNTKHHRAPGSIGGRTDPGRVWKGKKMPGRLGGERQTFRSIWLYKVDPERNLLYVRGQVPGPAGGYVYVRDAFRWRWSERQAANLPFPTYLGEQQPPVTTAKRDSGDPYRGYREDIGYFEANWKAD